MKFRVVNVRGCNAVGKSTAVREFINRVGVEEIKSIFLPKLKLNSAVTFCSENICVLGDYRQTSPGCDRYAGKRQIHETILSLIYDYSPRAIVYEGVINSKTAQGTLELVAKLCRTNYEYRGLLYYRTFESVLDHLEGRNGGKAVNWEILTNSFNSALSSAGMLEDRGCSIEYVNADRLSIEEMANPIIQTIWEGRK